MFSKTNSKQRALVIGLIILGILFTVFFGMRAFHAFRRFGGHRPPPGKIETDVELIRDWMTVPFISRMYRVSERDIFDALKISPLGSEHKSLKDLNHDYYPDKSGFVLETVKATILAHQPPPPEASRTPTTIPPPTAPVAP
jgi:hypothetical protein